LNTVVNEQKTQSGVQEISNVKSPQPTVGVVRVQNKPEPAAAVAPAKTATYESCLDLAASFLARG
jgi:hypothetical protein